MSWLKKRRQSKDRSGKADVAITQGDQALSDLRERVDRIRKTTKVVTIRAQSAKMRPER
jgi:hypothetical protein